MKRRSYRRRHRRREVKRKRKSDTLKFYLRNFLLTQTETHKKDLHSIKNI
jgi:hypothetical protein